MELCFGTFSRCTSNAIQGHFTMQYNRNDNMMSPYQRHYFKYDMGMMLVIMMGLMDMEVDKVADEVADMVVDRTGLTDVTLMSEETY